MKSSDLIELKGENKKTKQEKPVPLLERSDLKYYPDYCKIWK